MSSASVVASADPRVCVKVPRATRRRISADLRERRGVRRARRSRAGDCGGGGDARDGPGRRRRRCERGRERARADAGAEASTSDDAGSARAVGRRGVRRVRHRARRRARALDGPRFPPRMGPRPIRRRREEGRGDFDGGAEDGVPRGSYVRRLQRETHAGGEGHTDVQPGQLEGELPGTLLRDVEYTDGPGLTRIRGAAQMGTYLANQFQFSRQYLTVSDETCAADTYVAEWSLDMDLGTGELREMPGISVLRFVPAAEPAAG